MHHHIHVHLGDAGPFEESKHPRGPGGQFGTQNTRYSAEERKRRFAKTMAKQKALEERQKADPNLRSPTSHWTPEAVKAQLKANRIPRR